ncbi:MAG: hypothetical protein AAB731_02525 [Patescibacteria group bacterium]
MKRVKMILLVMLALFVLILLIAICRGLFGPRRAEQKSGEVSSAVVKSSSNESAPLKLPRITAPTANAQATVGEAGLDDEDKVERQIRLAVAANKSSYLVFSSCKGIWEAHPLDREEESRCVAKRERATELIRSALSDARGEYREYIMLCLDYVYFAEEYMKSPVCNTHKFSCYSNYGNKFRVSWAEDQQEFLKENGIEVVLCSEQELYQYKVVRKKACEFLDKFIEMQEKFFIPEWE